MAARFAIKPTLRAKGQSEARAAGVLLMAGSVFVLLSVVLPHPEGSDTGDLIATGVAMAALGVLAFGASPRVPLLLTHGLIALTAALTGLLIYESAIAAGQYGSIWVWATLIVAYYFPRRVAAAHVAWILVVYAVALAVVPNTAGYSPVTRWLFTGISLCVVMTFTSYIVARRARADRRARSFFDLSQDMLCTLDSSGRIVEVNDAWEAHLGYAPEELQGRHLIDLTHEDDRERAVAEAALVFEGKPSAGLENRVWAKDGSLHWLRSSAALAVEEDMLYARATDVTELKRVEDEREELLGQVAEMARSDALTGLPNRRALADGMPREMARARRAGSDLCLAVVDIDRFKVFNDTHGHLAGDRLLRECAIAWDGVVRGEDLLVRFGGEEFLVVLPDCALDEAAEIVERLRAATPGGQTCSAGVTVWDGVEDFDAMVARADSALYMAKAGGRDCLVQAPLVES
ncbi:MAG TPA: sensor domain-containing diguanylate cyclase [Solirubrobacterales bacterium]|nr:sensor domain-containing diguanylate cyclase [Solirubrobacterales bacterium]